MIRRAQPSEIQKIMAITRACATKMSAEGIHQWNEHYPNIQAFESDMKRQELYVYLLDEIVIGCITISEIKDEEYHAIDWLTLDQQHFYIHRLAVHPEHQKKGIAKQLMDFAENLAQKQNKLSIRLDTFSQNVRNQRFYEVRGYKRLGDIYFPKQSKFPFYCYEKILS